MNRKHLTHKGLLKFGFLTKSIFTHNKINYIPSLIFKEPWYTHVKDKLVAFLVMGLLFFGQFSLFAIQPAPTFSIGPYSFCEGDSLVFTLDGLPDPTGFPGGDVAVQITWYMSTSGGGTCGMADITDVESVTITSTSHTFTTDHILSYPGENGGLLMISTSILDPLNAEGGQEIIEAQTTCVPITVNPLPIGAISPTMAVAAICEGNTYQVDFTATVGTGPYDLIINGFTFSGISSGGTINLIEGVHFTGSAQSIDLTSITDTGVTPNCTTTGTPITNLTSPTLNAFATRGMLTADETICSGSVATNIIGSVSTGGTSVSYGWESSSDNGANWSIIGGEITKDYNPGVLIQDMMYRRIDTLNTGGVKCWTPIDTVTVTVNNITISKTLTVDEVVCEGQVPTPITGTAATLDGTPTYEWQFSTNDGGIWMSIGGANGMSYSPPTAITVDTWYQRIDTSVLNGVKCSAIMDTIKVFLNDFVAVGNFSTGDETICSGGDPSLIQVGGTSVGSGTGTGVGAPSYGWQLTIDGGTNWLSIPLATSGSYDPPSGLEIDTWYRRIDTLNRMGVKCTMVVDTTKVTVNNITIKGTLSADQVICAGIIPTPITGSVSMGDGAISYGWESTTNATTWNLVGGETGTGLTPGSIVMDTWYRRIDTTNLGGVKCIEIVDTIKILLNNFTALGNLNNPDDTICAGAIPTAITGNPSSAVGTVSYGWESNINSAGWNLIVGANGIGYTPPAIMEDTWYRRIDTSTLAGFKCIEIVDTVKYVVNNFTTLGTLSADQTSCSNFVPNPITGAVSVGDGMISYGWELSTDIGSGSWSLVVGTTGTGYSPPSLTADTWYRRIDTTTLGTIQCIEVVDTVQLIVNNITISAVLSADETVCMNQTPSPITGGTTTMDGIPTYGWEFSTNGTTWSLIGGATSIGYTPPGAIITDTWYRRVDTSDVGGVKCFEVVDTVKVFLNEFASIGEFLIPDVAICPGDFPPPILSLGSTGGDIPLTYGWELSIDDGTSWTPFVVGDITVPNYNPGAISEDTWYRRIDTISLNGVQCTFYADTAKTTVNNITLQGTLGVDEVVCSGITPSIITGTASTADGTLTYEWQLTTDAATWNTIGGANGLSYSPPSGITMDTWYRRIDTTNLGGIKCTEIIDTVKVLVNGFTSIGTLNNPDDTICAGVIPIPISGTVSTAVGTITYGWELTINNGTSWSSIGSATGTGYAPPSPITEDTWYRRIDTTTLSGVPCIEIVDTVKVVVNNFMAKGILGADETICEGTVPNIILGIGSTADGTLSYGWESSVNGTGYTPIIGATTINYSPPALAEDRWYRRIDTTTLGGLQCYEAIDTVKITVNNIVPATVLGADEVICTGLTPSPISGVAATTDGTATYGWELTIDAATWTPIAGATGVGYTPPSGISLDTWYRRIDTSNVGGVKCFSVVDTVKVLVNDFMTLGNLVTNDETICEEIMPSPIFGIPSIGGDIAPTFGWELSTDDGTSWTSIAGASTTNYNPPMGIIMDTWYRRIDTISLSGVKCIAIVDTVKVTVNNFLTLGSLVNPNDTICAGVTPNSILGNVTTGDGAISYGWEQTIDDGANWTGINLETSVNYIPSGGISTDTWYRRINTTTLGNNQCIEIVDTVKVIVNNFIALGTLNNPDDTICSGTIPTAITGIVSTADGSTSYGWEQTIDGSTWTGIAGATAMDYAPGLLNTDTWYRRIDTTTLGSTQCIEIVDTVKVIVNNLTALGALGLDETICEGTAPSTILGIASTIDGTISYGWESSTTGTGFTLIIGATGVTYTPPVLMVDMWYRRVDTTTLGSSKCLEIVDTVKITVNNIVISTVLSGDEVVCTGDTPSAITGIATTTDGGPTYGWELSANNGTTWTTIGGASGIGYTPPSGILIDTWYRRIDTSDVGGIKCFAAVDTVKVIINDFTVQGNLNNLDETICSGITPTPITGTASTGGDMTPTYGWELSIDDGATWNVIVGETGTGYTAPTGITADTWYRRIDTTSLSGVKCFEIADMVKVTVNNFLTIGNLINVDDTICAGIMPNAVIGNVSSADGIVSYGWEQTTDDGASWTTINFETSVNYIPLGGIIMDTWYRRVDTSTLGGVQCIEIVDTVKVIVNNFIAIGSLTNPDDTICSGVVPTAITGIASTGDGTISYGWEQSTNGSTWINIVGATTMDYAPGALTTDIWYRRIDTTTWGSIQCIEIVDTVKIIVNNLTALGVLGTDETICEGAIPSTILGTASLVDGILTYGWESSTTGTGFTPIIGATGMDYAPPALSVDMWYRRIDTTTLGKIQCFETVDTVKITVNNIAIANVLSIDQILCEGEIPDTIKGIPTNVDGTISYGWESNTNGTGWNVIVGASDTSFVPTLPVIADTWYRRIDTSNVGGVKCFAAVDTVIITVNPKPVPLIAGLITEICVGDAIYLPFTVSGGSGVYTDTTWLTSDVTRATVNADGLITGLASGFSNIRAVVTDANGCKDTSSTHAVIILPLPVAGAITGPTQVCMGDSITMTANPSGGNGGNIISWAITNGTGSATITVGGVLHPTGAGTVDVSYAVADNKSCSAISALYTVTIDTIPTPILVADDTTICQGDLVEFTASGGTSYEFLVNNISQQGPAVYDTFAVNNLNQNDSVKVVVANSNGCFDTSSAIIMVVDTIPVAILVSDAPGNAKGIGQTVNFTAGGGTSYEFFVNNISQGGASATNTFSTNTLSHLDTVMVEATDGNICSDTSTIIMTINGRPIAINDTIIIEEDALFTIIDVQANDSDPEGDMLTTTIVMGSTNGIDGIVNNDSIQYMPNSNFNGLDSIEYWVCDDFNNCAAAKIFITVNAVNDIPMANTDTLRITEDDPISLIEVVANDIDADGDSLVATILTIPSKGTAFTVGDSTIAYTPLPDSNGVDVIAYKVCDTKDSCGVGIVFIEITPVNDRPNGVKDSITINEDSLNIEIPILANDVDVDGDLIILDSVFMPTSGGTIIVNNDTVLYSPPAHYNGLDSIKYIICDTALCDTTYLIVNVLPVNEAPIAVKDSLTIPEDTSTIKIAMLANDIEYDGEAILLNSLVYTGSLGTVTVTNDTICYTPLPNANGIDSIKYVISDGIFKDSTYVIIDIQSINDRPIAVNDTVTVPEDSNPSVILVQLNDSDPDGDLFSTELVSGPSNGSAFAGGGAILYTPPPSFNGLDTMEYRICDNQVPQQCDTAIIFVTVTGVNDAPVAINDTICIGEDTSTVVIAIELNDFDIDGDPTTVSILTAANHALVDSIRNDSLIYQPATNFNGLDSIQYQLFDGSLADQAWVYITTKPRNDAPITQADSISILEDMSNVLIAVTINDSDPDEGDSIVVTVVTPPTSGGTAIVMDDTMLVYTPGANFFGIDTIIYKACDTSNVCTTDTVFITIQSVNEPPIAVDDFLTINEDSGSVIIDVQANDSDGDGDSFTTTIISSQMLADTLNGDSIMVTTATDFTGVRVVVYKICDALGLCDTANVTITILPINDAPIANIDTVIIPQDTTNVGIAPLLNDTDVDDITLVIDTVYSPTAANGTAIQVGTDSVLYTPLTGFSGLDTIRYTVCDTSNVCANGMIVVTIGFINTPPTAVDDALTGILEDGGVMTINVLANDSDIDGVEDSLKISTLTMPVNGGTATIVGDSTISYAPALNYNGLDSVQYTVCDTSMGCATAWVVFTITPVNDAPVAVNDTVFLAEDTTGAQLVVLTNDSDIDGDALTVTTIGNSTQGIATTIASNLIVYDAPAGFLGADTVTYKVTDAGGLMDTAFLIIIISDPNNIPPIANPDFVTTIPAIAVNADVQANDVEPNGDVLITSIINGPKAGNTASVLNLDSIQYTPSISFAGYDTLWYQVCDPSLTCDTSMLVILIENTLAISGRVILEGAYDRASSLMHDSLRKLNLLPVIEPYSNWPRLAGAYEFSHKNGGGNEIITNPGTVLGVTGPNAIVDWVYLELLTEADTIPVASRSALIQRDGDIVDVDGVSPVAFDRLPSGNYFLSIRHRNHLGVMTKTAQPFSMSAFSTLDFSVQGAGGTEAFGINAMDTVQSRLVLWAGDGNADRKIIYDGIANDRDPVFFDVITDPLNINSNYNHVSFGYHRGDYDMKGSAIYLGGGNDPDVIFFNVFLHPNNTGGSTIFIIREQIPR